MQRVDEESNSNTDRVIREVEEAKVKRKKKKCRVINQRLIVNFLTLALLNYVIHRKHQMRK